MRKVLLPDQMQQMDHMAINQIGIPGMVLIENAARALAAIAMEQRPTHAAILCGGGNNGADGMACARILDEFGIKTSIAILADPQVLSGDAAHQWRICGQLGLDRTFIASRDSWLQWQDSRIHVDLIIDALLGTGLKRHAEGLYAEVIEWMNHHPSTVISADIPSGIDGKNGHICGTAVRADHTVCFQCIKPGLLLFPGREYAGSVSIAPVGIPPVLYEGFTWHWPDRRDIARILPQRKPNTHKGHYGHVMVIAGSPGMLGAGHLCAMSALYSGSGLVTWAVTPDLLPACQGMVQEIMVSTLSKGFFHVDFERIWRGKDALAIGPGLSAMPYVHAWLAHILSQYDIPIVIDADGLNCLSQDLKILDGRRARTLVMTPHPGELSRLMSVSSKAIAEQPVQHALSFAKHHGVTVVLKGATTVIAAPDGRASFQTNGNPGMATGGSGDVLTGIITGFIAQGIEPFSAAQAACFIHGDAGTHASQSSGEYGLLAGMIAGQIGPAILRIQKALNEEGYGGEYRKGSTQ